MLGTDGRRPLDVRRAASRRRRRSPCRVHRARTRDAPGRGSRSRRRSPAPARTTIAVPCRGAGRPAAARTRPNAPRSSARWIASGGVPTMGTPASLRRCARPSGRLPAELNDDPGDLAGLLLGVDDLEHVLERQRLEVQPVAGVVVGRHRLRVAVDHHRLESGFAQRRDGVHAGVVELDALADAVRTAAEHQHLRSSVPGWYLGLVVVGGVEVRRQRGKLRRAGVDGLVDRPDAERMAQLADHGFVETADLPDLAIGEAQSLRGAQQIGGQLARAPQLLRGFVDQLQLGEEPGIDAGGVGELLDRRASAQRLLHDAEAPVAGQRRLEHQGLRFAGRRCPGERRIGLLHRSQRLLQRLGERSPDRHRFADRLHVGGERRVGGRETSRTRTAAP